MRGHFTNNNDNLFFLYARKSTESEDRQVRSIGDQRAELRELARQQNAVILEELEESQTAKVPGRPVFNMMLDRIQRGEASGILAWHPDRLARNSVDGGRIIHLVDSGHIRQLKFPTFWFDPTPQGKFMLAIAFGQSKYYVDNLSENIKRGQRQKLLGGIWPQMAPVGYMNDRHARTIAPDPGRAPLVRRAFELYAEGGWTLDRLTATVNKLGLVSRSGDPLSRAQYHRLLRNPIYYGLIRFNDELYEAKHEPLVPKHLFDRVQEVIRDRQRRHFPQQKLHPYRRLLRCGECGSMITNETQKGFHYLRCTKKKGPCSQRYLREEYAGAEVRRAMKRIALPPRWIEWMTEELDEKQRDSARALRDHRNELGAKITDLEAKLSRLTTAYLDHTLTLDEYRQLKNQLTAEKATVEGRLRELEATPEKRLEPLRLLLKALHEATVLVSGDDFAKMAKFLKTTGSNLILEDRHLHAHFDDPWKTVEKYGRLAQPERAPAHASAPPVGKTDPLVSRAEEKRHRSNALALLRVLEHLVDAHQDGAKVSPHPSPHRGGGAIRTTQCTTT